MRKLLSLTAILLASAACGAEAPTDPVIPDPTAAIVSMPGFSFSPFTTTIRAGESVVFDFPAEPHNVIFAKVTGAPADILVTSRRTVSRIFATVGTFNYDCTLHPGMAGVVIVQ
jgi:plastocyanin